MTSTLLKALLVLLLIVPCWGQAGKHPKVTVKNQIDPKLLKAAKTGDPAAQSDLGIIYYEGKKAPQSDKKALMWFNKAAAQGGIIANFSLRFIEIFPGGMSEHKDIIPKLKPAAEQGNTFAQILMPVMDFYKPLTKPMDILLEIPKAADEGNPIAQIVLEFMEILPKDMTKNSQEAPLELLKAAVLGNPLAQFATTGMSIFSAGSPTNDIEAMAKLRKAAENDNIAAQTLLLIMYTNGFGAKQSDEQAAALCQKIIQQSSPFTQSAMGILYASGIKIHSACEQPASWCDKSISVRKDHYNQGVLGRCMLWKKDFATSQEASTKANAIAPKVYAWAINLGHAYLLQGDQKNAHAWYEKAMALAKYSWTVKATLEDFDLFIKQGWQVEASKIEQAWLKTVVVH